MDRLNIFNHFVDKPLKHEDVLTRNFLLLLKNISFVQIGFFELIRKKMYEKNVDIYSVALGNLKVLEVHTQVTSGIKLKDYSGYNIISVIISDNELKTEHIVEESDRNARYDGVVICNPSWMFIIENKPSVENVWLDQMNPNEIDALDNKIIKEPCCLSWRDIISLLNNLLSITISSEIEKNFIEDFLEYVNDNYSWLNPYDRLDRCGNNKWLLDKRCAEVLHKAYDKEIKYHKGWKKYIDTPYDNNIVKQIALDYDEDGYIKLWMYAGDIMTGARELYEKIDIDKVRNLTNNGYLVRPNFHFSFRSRGLLWFSTSKISAVDYLNYWKNEQSNGNIKQRQKVEISKYYEDLVKKNIIDSKEDEFGMKIVNKNYQNLNIVPGCLFQYSWKLEEAIELDKKQDGFVSECRDKIDSIYSVFSENYTDETRG